MGPARSSDAITGDKPRPAWRMSATLKALQALYARARGARNIFDSPAASSRPVTALGICGILLLFLIIAIAAMATTHFRTRALADNERELQSLAGTIAQHLDEQLQGVELIQADILDEVRSLQIASGEDYARQMSTREMHAMLKSKIGGLPYISTLSLTGADGQLINSSQSWPAPQIRDGEHDDLKSARFGAIAESFIGQPTQQGADGAWGVAVGRKIVAANGGVLGLIVARLELASVQRFFRSILREKGGSSPCSAMMACCWCGVRRFQTSPVSLIQPLSIPWEARRVVRSSSSARWMAWIGF